MKTIDLAKDVILQMNERNEPDRAERPIYRLAAGVIIYYDELKKITDALVNALPPGKTYVDNEQVITELRYENASLRSEIEQFRTTLADNEAYCYEQIAQCKQWKLIAARNQERSEKMATQGKRLIAACKSTIEYLEEIGRDFDETGEANPLFLQIVEALGTDALEEHPKRWNVDEP